MSFLFKSKKPPPAALPTTTRNVHTSEGTISESGLNNGIREKEGDHRTQSATPIGSVNNSVNSLGGGSPHANESSWNRNRERSESDVGARRSNLSGQVPNAALYPWSQRRLTFPTPQSNPFPRYGAAANAVASKEGDIYMMGGLINGSVVKGDLWMIETGGGNVSCYPIATVSEGPGPRVGHSSLLVGNAFIVFGGDTKMDDSDTLDDTLYLLNTSSRQWSRASPPGPRPAGRYGHTLNILGSKIYVFGGQVEGCFFNDLLAFDLNALQNPTNQWEFLVRNSDDGAPRNEQIPPARTNHSVVTFNEHLYLFGGTNGTEWFNDVWTYDPRTNHWTQQDCIGYIPAPREGHSAALVNDVMYIFGGRTEEGADLGDLAAFRISSRRWYTFQNMGPSPSARSGHSMTAHGKQIIVIAGEPSSAPRDPAELSMVFVLDTAKIRYPNDHPAHSQTSKADQQGGPIRHMSGNEPRNAIASRSVSREGQHAPPVSKNGSAGLHDASAVPHPQPSRQVESPAPNSGPISRPPRTSAGQAPSGPPPESPAPTPRMNGVANNQSPTPNNVPIIENNVHGPLVDTIPATSAEDQRPLPSHTESSRVSNRTSREASPAAGQGRRTPTQQPVNKAKAMEVGEAAPLMSNGPSRQRSLRSQRGQGSLDSSEDGLLGRPVPGRTNSDGVGDSRSLRSLGDEPRSPRLTPHQEALMKELDAAKSRNAWFASELALARKAGYQSVASLSPTFDERAVNQFGDEDKPLIEALLAMRAELGKMQQTVDQQAASAAKRVGEVEHQRDAAISEAAYARAKLAAYSGSQRSTPQPDMPRDVDDHPERTTDISRRLALALAAQSEHKAKLDSATHDLSSERHARELAEEAAEVALRRLEELSHDRHPTELEGLRTELHEAQRIARDQSGQRAHVEEQLRMLQLDKDELTQKYQETSNRLAEHTSALGALQAAVAASADKANVLQRQLGQERTQRDALEEKLVQLRAEHEERTAELESTARRLRDAEELTETHAKEATTHREAFMAGLLRVRSPGGSPDHNILTEQRILVLQQSADRAHDLARSNQEAADLAVEKLRSAEERIAGLEAYQEQSSREGVQIRRQLQAALKDVQAHQGENRELKASLETQQRNANALAVQHGALKDLLGERNINISDARRSPMFDNSPGSRFSTPDQNRLRELEQQLQSSMRAHEETKHAFESDRQEADRTYREKIEQLENDYQSTIHYVKGTEKILRKMKDELERYKTNNRRLQTELETAKGGEHVTSKDESGANQWTRERATLEQEMEDLNERTGNQLGALRSQIATMEQELASIQSECDHHKINHKELLYTTEQAQSELGQLKSENSMLETRALDAEHKVTMLLDQVGQSVGNYRRQSQVAAAAQHNGANGAMHNRQQSASTTTSFGGREQADSSSENEMYVDNRGSLALDSLASELDALRSHWESTNRSYRLSSQLDFERTPRQENSGGELSESLANWKKRLDEEEEGARGHGGAVKSSTVVR